MRFFLMVAVALATMLPAQAAELPTSEKILTIVRAWEQNPITPALHQQIWQVVRFARESPLVQVRVSPVSCPYVKEDDDVCGPVLLAAYLAGNMKAQLETGLPGDQSYEGVLFSLHMYQVLRRERPGYRSPGLDQLAELESRGELRAYLDQKLCLTP